MVTCEEGWMAASFGGSIHDNIASRRTGARKEGAVWTWERRCGHRSQESWGLAVLWNRI